MRKLNSLFSLAVLLSLLCWGQTATAQGGPKRAPSVTHQTVQKGIRTSTAKDLRDPIPAGMARIILEAHDVWQDGTGYQMLWDDDHDQYGASIPEDGFWFADGTIPDGLFDPFEYKVPVNADASFTPTNFVLDGTASADIPAGTYDYVIINPNPDLIYIVGQGVSKGNDYVVEAGKTYHFTVKRQGSGDAASVVVTGEGGNEFAPVQNLQWSVSGQTVTLTWQAPASDKRAYVLNESFDTETLPNGWTMIDADGDGRNWLSTINVYNTATHTGNGAMFSRSWESNTGAKPNLSPDNYLVTPKITVPQDGELTYWISSQIPWENEHYGVFLSTTGNEAANFTVKLFEETLGSGKSAPANILKSEGAKAPAPYQERTIDLSAYAGQDVYLAFRHFDCTGIFRLYLDDVAVSGGGVSDDYTYTVYRDNVVVAQNLTATTFKQENVAPGQYNYCVEVKYTAGVSPKVCKDVTVPGSGEFAPVQNLTGSATGQKVTLKWDAPSGKKAENFREVKRIGDGLFVMIEPANDVRANEAKVVLVADNVWGDNTGYQFLLDAQHNTFGDVIPASGPLFIGSAPADLYSANFEYLIPANADPVVTTQNIIVTGQGEVVIPSGVYDYCITNPEPASGKMWIAGDGGNQPARYDDFTFESGKKYTFTMGRFGTGDGADMVVENESTATYTYTVYRDGTKIKEGLTATTFEEDGVAVGNHEYCVEVKYQAGISPKVCKDVTVPGSGEFAPVQNLTGSATGQKVTLKWDAPAGKGGELLNENFEGGAIPAGWTALDADGDGNNWDVTFNEFTRGERHAPAPLRASNVAISYSSLPLPGGGYQALTPDNYLITPKVEGAKKITYKVGSPGNQNWCHEHYALCISKSGTAASDFEVIFEETMEYTNGGANLTREKDLPAGTKYVAFRHNGSTDIYAIIIDDVVITGEGGSPAYTYTVYRDGTKIKEGLTATTFEEDGVAPGSHEYCVEVKYETGVSPKKCVNVTVDPVQLKPVQNLTTAQDGNDVILKWEAPSTSKATRQVKRLGDALMVTIEPADDVRANEAKVVLVADNVWGDNTGYQFLLDAQHNTFGDVIPASGPLFIGSAPADLYSANFEYLIPANADPVVTTQNIIVTGQGEVVIPSGVYDYCITNPEPASGKMWIAGDGGNQPARYDDFTFESGKKYTFTMGRFGTGDGADMVVENESTATYTYTVYRDGTKIKEGLTETTYKDLGQANANHEYCVEVQYATGVSPKECVTFSSVETVTAQKPYTLTVVGKTITVTCQGEAMIYDMNGRRLAAGRNTVVYTAQGGYYAVMVVVDGKSYVEKLAVK